MITILSNIYKKGNHKRQISNIIYHYILVKLKDPFPPARIAGINAFAATQQYYSLTDTSIRVLPMICSLMVDPEKPVRDQAFKVRKI